MTYYAAFDLETTGIDIDTSRIVSGTIIGHPSYTTDLLLNPGVPIPAIAAAVHGITDAHAAAHGIDYTEGVIALGDALAAAWRTGAVVVGHNIDHYDLPLLRAQERALFGVPRTEFGPTLDTWLAYKAIYPGNRGRLVDVCAHLGITLDNAHTAAADAQASLDLAYALTA